MQALAAAPRGRMQSWSALLSCGALRVSVRAILCVCVIVLLCMRVRAGGAPVPSTVVLRELAREQARAGPAG